MKISTLILASAAGLAALVQPLAPPAKAAEPGYDVVVERTSAEIYDPWTQRPDKVEVRAIRNEGAQGEGTLMAPELRARPGEILRLGVRNALGACPAQKPGDPACFNLVNIHTHGLWVSPSGNSDNVAVTIAPGQRFDYEFAVPADHPAGTFWYHPHIHGATTVHLASGMAGALIVEGERVPTMERPGDVDILFTQGTKRAFGDHVWLFSQIQYGCYDPAGRLRATDRPEDGMPTSELEPWSCAPGEVGTVDDWDLFGRFRENTSGRLIGINGAVQPTLGGFVTGRFERLRLIHAGLRLPVRMSIRKLAAGAPLPRDVPGREQAAWIARYCTGAPVQQFHFADDGLTRSAMEQVDKAILFPGSRFDGLVYFSEPGRYCVVNELDEQRVFGLLEVTGPSAPQANLAEHLAATLSAAARQRIANGAVRARVLADIAGGLHLGAFVWHAPIRDAEVTGHQTAVMSIDDQPDGSAIFGIDGRAYGEGQPTRRLTLGATEEWEVSSKVGNHPFHIHVNPFEVVAVRDDKGRDVTTPGTESFDPDYAGVVGSWRDTIIVKAGYHLTMRTRYRRYLGDFVMHCHFASHGDSGMMQNVSVVLPGEGMAHHMGH